ncbi:hypothetical protein ON010_g2485 [Phytophthora cinnamomi]|nr:hypothetical protein ON010_g2485 [Phytophthora cinnamomi]
MKYNVKVRCSSGTHRADWYSKANHIAHKNAGVDAANMERLLGSDANIVHVHALHHVQQKVIHQQREIPEGTVSALISEAKTVQHDSDSVVATRLMLCAGALVTLIFNLEPLAGLRNGTNGVIYDLIFFTGSEFLIVLIKVTDPYPALAKLTTPPYKVAVFAAEESRVAAAVSKTMETALPVVQQLKLLARLHNSAVPPRV